MQKPNPLNIILFPQGHNPSHSRFKQKICKIRWTIHLTVRQHTVLNTAHICIWICMIRTGSKHWYFPIFLLCCDYCQSLTESAWGPLAARSCQKSTKKAIFPSQTAAGQRRNPAEFRKKVSLGEWLPKNYNGQEFELHELWAIARGGACLHSITLCKAKYLKVKPNHNVSIVGLSLIRNTDIKQIDFAFCVLKAIISNIPLINKCSNVVLEVYGMDWVLWMSRRR